jgi:hypothetical protein
MQIMLETDATWTFTIAGEQFEIYADQIPPRTILAIVQERLREKGRDAWADSSKVTATCSRQDLWSGALSGVYDGSWCPGISGGRGARKKNLSFEDFLYNKSLAEAKRRIGKTGYIGTDGTRYKANDDNALAALTSRFEGNAKYREIARTEYENLHKQNEVDV